MQWISMLSFSGGPAFTPSGNSAAPLDIWIGQSDWERPPYARDTAASAVISAAMPF
jgi:hypothetical protein